MSSPFRQPLLISALCLLSNTGVSLAVAAGDPIAPDTVPPGLFSRLDANKDGVITREETPTEHRRLFERLLRTSDKDQSGSLTPAELAVGLAPSSPDKPIEKPVTGEGPNAKFTRLLLVKLDANGDQTLTRAEAPENLQRAFDRLVERADRNDDGRITRLELNRSGPGLSGMARQISRRMKWDVDAELAQLKRKQGDAIYRFDDPTGPSEALKNPQRAKQLFNELDFDGNGKLTLAELPEPLRERFKRLFQQADANADRALSKQEYLLAAERLSNFLTRVKGNSQETKRPNRNKRKQKANKGKASQPTN